VPTLIQKYTKPTALADVRGKSKDLKENCKHLFCFYVWDGIKCQDCGEMVED